MITQQIFTQYLLSYSGAIELDVHLEEVDPEYISPILISITLHYTRLILVRKRRPRKNEKSYKSPDVINVRIVAGTQDFMSSA